MSTTIGPIAVAASADDASELATTVVSLTANPLANCDTTGVWNGWRFTGITIPAGSTIIEAHLTVRFTSSTLDEPDVTFYGEDVASPSAFVASNGNISGRTRTTASVDWSNTNAGTGDVNTSDLKTIIQELLNSYSYSSGAMVLLMTTRAASGTRDTSVTSFDGSSVNCARLSITHTVVTPQAVGGALTSAGTLRNKAKKVLSGTLASFGIVASVKKVFLSLGGALTTSGTVREKTSKMLSGTLTTAGNLLLKSKKVLFGALTVAGTLLPKAKKVLLGTLTSAGTTVEKTRKLLSGVLSGAGNVAAVFIPGAGGTLFFQPVSGILTSSGIVIKKTALSVEGVLSTSGGLLRKTLLYLSGSLTGDGVVLKRTAFHLSGALSSEGLLLKRTFTHLFGSFLSSGTVLKRTLISLSGMLSGSGTLSARRVFFVVVGGILTTSGTLKLKTGKILGGVLSSSGALSKKVFFILSGILGFVGNLIAQIPGVFQHGKVVVVELKPMVIITERLSPWLVTVEEERIGAVAIIEQPVFSVSVDVVELWTVEIEEQEM